jgi:uncharacterized protein (TIGR02145 family)/uncharacterized repeat protein (TIGR02543 family)
MVYTAATTIYARWTLNTYKVAFNSQGGSVVDTQSIEHGGKVTEPIAPIRTGYTFGGWYKEVACTNVWAFAADTVTSAITLYAKWNWIGKGNDINNYRTVTIGNQKWMAENLDYNVEGSKCYGNSADSCAKYGRLYNWETAMNIDAVYTNTTWGGSDVKHQGVCPVGWHLPSDAEWTTLEENTGGSVAGRNLKSTNGWNYDGNGTDVYEFSALPGGSGYLGLFHSAGDYGSWWSTTEINAWEAWLRSMKYSDEDVYRSGSGKASYLNSVRCVQD